MKKILSMALTFSMLLTSAVFAAPAPVATETAGEAYVETAEMLSETAVTPTFAEDVDTSGMGDYLFYEDFSRFADKVGQTLSFDEIGTFANVNPEYASVLNPRFQVYGSTKYNVTIRNIDGNIVGELKPDLGENVLTTNAGTRQLKMTFGLYNEDDQNWETLKMTGKYNILFDMMKMENSVIEQVDTFFNKQQADSQNDNARKSYELSTTAWKTINVTNTVTADATTQFNMVRPVLHTANAWGTTAEAGAPETRGVYIDNIALYYTNPLGKKPEPQFRGSNARDTYGDLLIFEDFQGANWKVGNSYSYGTNVDVAWYDTNMFTNFPTVGSDSGSAVLKIEQDPDGNKYAVFTPAAAASNTFYGITKLTYNKEITEPGRYYSVADVYVEDNTQMDTLRTTIYYIDKNGASNVHGTEIPELRRADLDLFREGEDTPLLSKTWQTAVGRVTYDATNKHNLWRSYFFSNGPSTTDATGWSYRIDNIALYRNYARKVTFDANGMADAVLPAEVTVDTLKFADYTASSDTKMFIGWSYEPDGEIITDTSVDLFEDVTLYANWTDTVTVSFNANGLENVTLPTDKNVLSLKLTDYTAASDTKAFVGWSYEPDGQVITDAVVNFTEDTVLYAVWGDDVKYHPVFSSEFNDENNFKNSFNAPGSSAANSYPAGSVRYEWMQEGTTGFERLTFVAKDPATSPFVGDPQMENKLVKLNTPLLLDNVKGLEIRFRVSSEFSNISDESIGIYYNLDNGPGWDGNPGTFKEAWKLYVGIKNIKDWQTAFIDFSGLDGTAITKYRIDPIVGRSYHNLKLDIDYIRPVLKDNVTVIQEGGGLPTFTSKNGADISDYRTGYIEAHYTRDIGVDAEDYYTTIINDVNGLIDPASVTYDPSTFTYTMAAKVPLIGKTFEVSSNLTETAGEIKYKTGYAYNFVAKNFTDGENLVPNGDLSNPYYNVWVGSTLSRTLSNGKVTVEVNPDKNGWQGAQVEHLMLQPNTKYYYDVKIEVADDCAHLDADSRLTLYVPWQDGLFDGGVKKFHQSISESRHLTNDLKGQVQTSTGIISMFDESVYSKIARKNDTGTEFYGKENTAYSSMDALIAADGIEYTKEYHYRGGLSGWHNGYVNQLFVDNKGSNLVLLTNLSNQKDKTGIKYNIISASVKEMWPVAVDVNGGTGEQSIYFAKDVAIVLPDCTITSADGMFAGWDIGGKTYLAGDTYTATEFKQDIEIKPLWADVAPSTFADINDVTIRIDEDDVTAGKYTAGMRYMASIRDDQKEQVSEYGFIVARRVTLAENGLADNKLAFDCGVTTASGVAYQIDDDGRVLSNKVWDEADEVTYFTGVLVEIPETEEALNEILVGRPYSKIGEQYFYGTPVAFSIADVAMNLVESEAVYNMTAEEQEKIAELLSIAGRL